MPEQSQSLVLGKGLGDKGRLRDSIAIREIGFALADHVPNSGQEHAADGDDGFLVTTVSFDAAVANAEFRVILGFNDSVGDLNKKRFQVGARFGDAGRLDSFIALVVSGAATRPRDEILGRREHGHINADFRDDGDSRHGIVVESRDGVNQVEGGCERGDEAVNFDFDFRTVLLKFIDMVETLTEFDSLLMGNSAVHSGLDLGDCGFTAPVNERRNVKCLPGARQDILGDGTCGLSEHIREHIVELEVGHGETVLGAILFAGDHVGELHVIANEVAKLADDRRWNKAGLDHAAHEKVTNPTSVLAVCLVALHGLGILGVSERNLAGLFEDVEHGNPVFPGGFHADLGAVQLCQPTTKVSKAFGKSVKPGFMVIGSIVIVDDANASVIPSLVNVEAAAVIQDEFEHGIPPAIVFAGSAGTGREPVQTFLERGIADCDRIETSQEAEYGQEEKRTE